VQKLNKYIIDPVTKRLKTPLINGINALPEGLKNSLYQAYKRFSLTLGYPRCLLRLDGMEC
jgi:hypothetical protein